MSGPFSDLPDGTRVWVLLDTDGDIDSVYLSWDEARLDLERRGIVVSVDPPADSDIEAQNEYGEITDFVPRSDVGYDQGLPMAANASRRPPRGKISVVADERPRHTPVGKLLRNMALEPLTRSSLTMPLKEAFGRLQPYLPPAWRTPEKAAQELLRQNGKNVKTGTAFDNIASYSLSMLPHSLFSSWIQRGLSGKAPGDRDYLRLFYREGDEELPAVSVCPASVDGCRRGCLVFTGLNFLSLKESQLATVRAKAAVNRCLYRDPEAFGALLHHAVLSLKCQAHLAGRTQLAVRLNNYSDIPWEVFYPDLFDAHPEVMFYDYTKVPGRYDTPPNYHLTFSYAGGNLRACEDAIQHGRSVATVFLFKKEERTKKPSDQDFPTSMRLGRLEKVPVVSGTVHDARWLDEVIPAVVGLVYLPGNEIIYDELKGSSLARIDPESLGNFLVRAELQGGYMVVVQKPALTANSDTVIA